MLGYISLGIIERPCKDGISGCEFPLTSLCKRPDGSLVFSDTQLQQRTKRSIERRLIITGSLAYGLPSSVDDEVITALIQVSARKNFQLKTVECSVSEILKLLGWKPGDEDYYQILKEVLLRWTGVSLTYEYARLCKDRQRWSVVRALNIVDNTLMSSGEVDAISVTWTDAFYESFLEMKDSIMRRHTDGDHNLARQ